MIVIKDQEALESDKKIQELLAQVAFSSLPPIAGWGLGRERQL